MKTLPNGKVETKMELLPKTLLYLNSFKLMTGALSIGVIVDDLAQDEGDRIIRGKPTFTAYDGVLLVGILNDLAESTKAGFVDYHTYAENPDEYDGWVVYDTDDRRVVFHSYEDTNGETKIEYVDDGWEEVEIVAFASPNNDGDAMCIKVSFPIGEITVKDGAWYVSDI